MIGNRKAVTGVTAFLLMGMSETLALIGNE